MREIGIMHPVRIGGTGAAMPTHKLIEWVEAAAVGAELAYAEGALPKWTKALPLVRDLANRDIVFAFCDASVSPPQYVIRRLDKGYRPAAKPLRIAREIAPRDDEQKRLLAVLTALARAGKPCPYNRALAEKAELKNGDRASYLLKCLRDDGFIRNDASCFEPKRIITIVGKLDRAGREICTGVVA